MASPSASNATQTRADILAAARVRFGSDGYEPTTLRAVASYVGSDPARVIRYFGSKQELFAAAAEFTLDLPDLTAVHPDDVADALLPSFFAAWEEDATFVALLRTAITQRAVLMGAFVVGFATARYVLNTPTSQTSVTTSSSRGPVR